MAEILGPSAPAGGPLPGPLTHSELKTFRTCRRKWWLTYRRHLDAPETARAATGVAQLGTNVHAALEGHYTGLDALDVLAVIYDGLQDRRPEDHHAIALERSWAMVMVKGYLQWVSETGVDAQYAVVGTEVDTHAEMLLPGHGTLTLRGKLDQVVERRDGSGIRLVRDFKTVGSLSKADDLIRDTQMRFYDLIHTLTAPHGITDGVLYTMILRSKRTAKATPPFFGVVHMGYNQHDRISTREAVKGTAYDMIEADRRLTAGEPHHRVVYPNPTEICNWGCPFLSVCHLADDGSRFEDALSETYRQADPWDHYGTEQMDAVRVALGGRVDHAGTDMEGSARG